MSDNGVSLRRWIARQPRPDKLVCTMPDGDEKTVRVGTARTYARDAEAACLGAMRVEAFNDKAESLRVTDLDVSEESATANVSKGKVVAGSQEAMLVRFAELLTEASDKSAQRHAEAFQVGIAHLSTMLESFAKRLETVEKMLFDARAVIASAQGAQETTADILAKNLLPSMGPELAKALPGIIALLAAKPSETQPVAPKNGKAK